MDWIWHRRRLFDYWSFSRMNTSLFPWSSGDEVHCLHSSIAWQACLTGAIIEKLCLLPIDALGIWLQRPLSESLQSTTFVDEQLIQMNHQTSTSSKCTSPNLDWHKAKQSETNMTLTHWLALARCSRKDSLNCLSWYSSASKKWYHHTWLCISVAQIKGWRSCALQLEVNLLSHDQIFNLAGWCAWNFLSDFLKSSNGNSLPDCLKNICLILNLLRYHFSIFVSIIQHTRAL